MGRHYEDIATTLVAKHYANPDNCKDAMRHILSSVVSYRVGCVKRQAPVNHTVDDYLGYFLTRAMSRLKASQPHGCLYWYALKECDLDIVFNNLKALLLSMVRIGIWQYPHHVVIGWVSEGLNEQDQLIAVIALGQLEREFLDYDNKESADYAVGLPQTSHTHRVGNATSSQ